VAPSVIPVINSQYNLIAQQFLWNKLIHRVGFKRGANPVRIALTF